MTAPGGARHQAAHGRGKALFRLHRTVTFRRSAMRVRLVIASGAGTAGAWSLEKALHIAPSAVWREAARRRNLARCPPRRQRDAVLLPEIERVWRSNLHVYRADKVWKQLRREGNPVARCTVEQLMRAPGWRGVIRGKTVCTTGPDAKAPCPRDLVNREFHAEGPNPSWVSDFTHVSTW